MPTKIPSNAYAIIIGAMKCGTSSLFNYLQNHPEICPSFTKEPEFFSENQSHALDRDNYEDLFAFNSNRHKYALEASTGYSKFPSEPSVPKRMHEYGIKPKFIYLIRDPFERIESHFSFMQRRSTWRNPITHKQLISTSNYFLQLERFRQYYSADQFLIVDFEDLKHSPEAVLKRVYSYLNLSHCYFPDSYQVVNTTSGISRQEIKLRRSRIGPIIDLIPRPMKKLGRKLLLKVSGPQQRVTLTVSEREIIFSALKDDMHNLKKVYGFDVTKWGF